MVDERNFLRRWSRRKLESVKEQPRREPEQPDARPAAAPAQPVANVEPRVVADAAPVVPQRPAELPAVDSLEGLASDYRQFLHPQVDEDLRRSALKKLFHDPHFNVMDGLDVYIDDYSKPDPIPESMLKELLARHLEFPDPAEQTAQREADARLAEGPRPGPESPAPEAAMPNEPAPAADAASEVPARADEEKR